MGAGENPYLCFVHSVNVISYIKYTRCPMPPLPCYAMQMLNNPWAVHTPKYYMQMSIRRYHIG